MTPKQKEILEIIKKWVKEYNLFTFNELENRDNAFTMEILSKSNPNGQPIYVMGHKDDENIIIISWVLHLDDQTKESVRIIDSKVKRKFEQAMKTTLEITKIEFTLYDSVEDIKVIYVERYVNFTKLSKQKLYEQIIDLKYSMKFVEKKFVEFFSVPIEFDPSSNV